MIGHRLVGGNLDDFAGKPKSYTHMLSKKLGEVTDLLTKWTYYANETGSFDAMLFKKDVLGVTLIHTQRIDVDNPGIGVRTMQSMQKGMHYVTRQRYMYYVVQERGMLPYVLYVIHAIYYVCNM